MFLLGSSRRQTDRFWTVKHRRGAVLDLLRVVCYSPEGCTGLSTDYSLFMSVKFFQNKILVITEQFIASRHELPTRKQ